MADHDELRKRWRDSLEWNHWVPVLKSRHDDIWISDGTRQLELFWPYTAPPMDESMRGRVIHPPDYDPFVEHEVNFAVRFSFRSHDPKQLAKVDVFDDPENSYHLHLIVQGGKN